ncbi:MAG: hypothetical protein KKE29_19875 [Proteobacteria bacterium]|nr:hypothetical protein [Pseudomonadota bacterium]MBU4574432.1 hypothetical protein [Pseudomonadota bacterium]MBV1715949.1 hypothetical protein [Desulfarculus sp.]
MTGIKREHILYRSVFNVYLNGCRVARASRLSDLPGWAKGLPLLGGVA